MSGHSHFATIKRQKETKDAAKGNLFGKLSKMISIAIKAGGGPNPDANFKLRVAIDKARSSNMPKENIDRILKNAIDKMDSVEEIRYEGFGPYGLGVLVDVATDNKNRTAQEMKSIFEKAGGQIAGPGAVAYNFDELGYFQIEKKADVETQLLSLIDMGADDVEESDYGIEVYLQTDKMRDFKNLLESGGFKITKMEVVMRPKSYIEGLNDEQIDKVSAFLENLEDHDDVQRVFSNF